MEKVLRKEDRPEETVHREKASKTVQGLHQWELDDILM